MKKLFFLFLFFCCANLSSYSQKANDSINHYYNIFTASKNSTELVKAYSYFNRNKDLLLESGDTISAIYNLRYIASIQSKLGLVFESEETSVSSLKLINSLSRSEANTENKIGVLNHLGLIYRELNDYERALNITIKC